MNMKLMTLLTISSLIASPVWAAGKTPEASTPAPAKPMICEKLKDEKAYKKKSGYRILIEGLDGTLFRTRSDLKSDFNIKRENIAYFEEFNNALKSKGTHLVIVMPPTRGIMFSDKITPAQKAEYKFDEKAAFDSYLKFAGRIRETGVTVTDFADIKPPVAGYFYKRDHHWTPEGAKAIKALPVYKDLRTTPFKTELTGQSKKPGSFSEFINAECQSAIPDEPVNKYETSATGDDLFGDKKPQVTLIGTSNCREEAAANFPGWLREAISADVENLSIGGGGIDTPMLSYLTSGEYAKNTPKVLVWEMASHYLFSRDYMSIFRQAIPTMAGACDSKALVKNKIKAAPAVTVYDKKTPLNADRGYVMLSFDKPLKGKITIRAVYDGAGEKVYDITRDSRFVPSAHYFYLLDDAPLNKLTSLKVDLPKDGQNGNVNAALCALPKG